MTREEIFAAINKERDRQDDIHPGSQPFLAKPMSILAEECGEVAHAVNEADRENLIEELIHVAATATRWLEYL